jgi:hydroxypyruvate isomerase
MDKPIMGEPFKLKYAPHFGMFGNHGGEDLVDQLKFAADVGFRAWEDNGMMGKEIALQERLAKAMTELDIEMGVFVADADFGTTKYVDYNPSKAPEFRKIAHEAVEVAKRVNAKWCTVVPGRLNDGLEYDYQMANCIEALKVMASVMERGGLTMVLEPLNSFANHAFQFLKRIPQANLICKGVASPSCKILDDLYHQQIEEGNLIPNINKSWSEIAYFQMGDNPGRQEPLTGEINYRSIFKHVHRKGFTGIMGMEHGKSQGGKAGEIKLINAYRWCDDF